MNVKRKFIPGEEWFYLKLYSGPKMLEQILINEIYNSVKHFYNENIIDKFFFIRYMEDGYHLRLRFHLIDPLQTGSVLNKISSELKKYTENRIIAKIIADTYSREIERYGSASIENVETIFSINSLQILETLRITQDYTDRWLLGIKIMDHLLNKFNLTLHDKHVLHESYFRMYFIEFEADKQTLAQLKKQYRNESNRISETLIGSTNQMTESLLASCSNRELSNAIDEILKLQEKESNQIPLDRFIKNIMHMHYNRLFRTRQRFHEFVLYYMLSNSYKSLYIRQKND